MDNLSQTFIHTATTNNLYWSYGTHPDWAFDCRMWTYYYNKNRKRFIPTCIGQGNTLEEAIQDCLNKFAKVQDNWRSQGYIK